MTRLATRLEGIAPFRVMEVLARARTLEAQGRSVIHLEIGEPDFPTAEGIVQAGTRALAAGRTAYLPALGLDSLREAIAQSYPATCRPDPSRVLVTPGASGALLLVLAALVNPGDRVLLTDPGYPCNRHFVRLLEGEPQPIPVGPDTNYQASADLLRARWGDRTIAALLASPANPTGTMVPREELARSVQTVAELGGALVVDEIYHGLTYDVAAESALALSQDVFVVNSFSKYYGMTGWRIGWLVAPPQYVAALERLAQNLYISVSTPAQYAALAAFDPEVRAELERRRAVFHERRDFLVPALRDLGFEVPVVPEGAFYVYADCSRFARDSDAFARDVLTETGVAITPGVDFGAHEAHRHVRFSYANTIENLEEAVRRLKVYLRHKRQM